MAMRRVASRSVFNRPSVAAGHAPSAPRPRQLDPEHRGTRRPFEREIQLVWTRSWAVPIWLYRGFTQSNAGDLAAAIAYHALIALVPSFLLLISVAGFVFKHDDAALHTALGATFWALPSDAARGTLESLIKAREYHGWIGTASVLGFAWAGTGFMTSLARGMNRVYGVPNRQYVHQRLRAFAVVVIFAILFQLAVVAATLPTYAIRQDFVSYFQPWLLTSEYGRFISYAVAFIAAFVLFLSLFLALPNAGQRPRDVWPGTITATLLFVAIVQVFPIYLRLFHESNQFSQIFGLGSLLVFWFYVLAHVLLFSTFVNVTWQCHRHPGRLGASCPRIVLASPEKEVGAVQSRLRRIASAAWRTAKR